MQWAMELTPATSSLLQSETQSSKVQKLDDIKTTDNI